MAGSAVRMAAQGLAPKVMKGLRDTMRMSDDSGLLEDLVANFGIDAAFGVMQGVMTPGDLREKLIAGTTTAVGGGIGGLGASAMLPGKAKTNMMIRQPVEVAGGFIGDMAGQMVGDQTQRLTSADGKTAYERLADDQRRQIEQQTLAALGMGGYNLTDFYNV